LNAGNLPLSKNALAGNIFSVNLLVVRVAAWV